MAADTKEKLIRSAFFILTFALMQCANQLPPKGGEVDKIPPVIVSSFPEDGTLNFHEDYFELEFSEYVDKRSVKDAIFISPAQEGEPELEWTGTTVTVYFPDKLRDSTTYVITIGTDVLDYNNKNRMAESFVLTFSTGDKIDKHIITGRVFDREPVGTFIFGYKIKADTTNFLDYFPDYISQCGSDGRYKMAGLPEGRFRLFAVKDKFRDYSYQWEQDNIGIPHNDIYIMKKDSLTDNINFLLSVADTVRPRLISALMTDINHVLLNFTETINTKLVTINNFTFIDSVSGKVFNPVYSYKGNTKTTEYFLVINENIESEQDIYILTDTIYDFAGNYFINDYTRVTTGLKPDTTAPVLFEAYPRLNSDNFDFQNPEIKFRFDDAILFDSVSEMIQFEDSTGKEIEFGIMTEDDATLLIKPIKDLTPSMVYKISLNLNLIKDAAGNYQDSIYEHKFTTMNNLDFTGVSGNLDGFNTDMNPVLTLSSVDDTSRVYKIHPSKDQQFSFQRIRAGIYVLAVFYDTDSSFSYTYGWPYPLKYSEFFSVYPDTLELRPRWSLTDLKFRYE
ncbi:MAG: hypothetical protein Kow0098_20390 [Ignavibacteriaceae bacterium]